MVKQRPPPITADELNAISDTISQNQNLSIRNQTVWQKIYSQTVAGAYNWIAPDLYGDGKSYDIGVFIIGGGGGGGASARTASILATGGASGRSFSKILSVSPGAECQIVVGNGGSGVSATYNGDNVIKVAEGSPGGSSSFGGMIANGGEGGLGGQGKYTSSAFGGQGSDCGYNEYRKETPGGGQNIYTYYGTGNIVITKTSVPAECFNPFENNAKVLFAGGLGYYESAYYPSQSSVMVGEYTTSGGAGKLDGARANKGTLPGCGGGGCAAASSNASFSCTATSADGCDGAVYIYAPKSLS